MRERGGNRVSNCPDIYADPMLNDTISRHPAGKFVLSKDEHLISKCCAIFSMIHGTRPQWLQTGPDHGTLDSRQRQLVSDTVVSCKPSASYGIKSLIFLQDLLYTNSFHLSTIALHSIMSSSFYADAVLFDMASVSCYVSAGSLTDRIPSGRHAY
jgi:hypothetical protein